MNEQSFKAARIATVGQFFATDGLCFMARYLIVTFEADKDFIQNLELPSFLCNKL